MKIVRKIYYLLPPSMRYIARRVVFLPIDAWETVTGKREKYIPPKGLIFVGPGDYKKNGEIYLKRFIEHGKLMPNHRVLDVGCGIGRMAVPLISYLNSEGSYEGFDIVKMGIDWCIKHIKPENPNFNFKHIDLKNDLYNLKTNAEAKDFVFPYQDNQFDFVFLTSVFTHMMPADVDNYLKQIYRVLKYGGTCYATFFILDDENSKYLKPDSQFKFTHNKGRYSLMDENVKEANIAYNIDFVEEMVVNSGLKIEKLLHGHWCGRPVSEGLDFQDAVILTKV